MVVGSGGVLLYLAPFLLGSLALSGRWLLSAALSFLFALKYHAGIFTKLSMLPRDIHLISRMLVVLIVSKWWEVREETLPKAFLKTLSKRRKKIAFRHLDQDWTFQQVYDVMVRVGWLLRDGEGLERGDTIALMMDTRPLYPSLWLGSLSAGLITALINTHQRSSVLLHSLRIAKPKVLIYGVEHSQAISEISSELEEDGIVVYCSGGKGEVGKDFDAAMADVKAEEGWIEREIAKGKLKDKALYIYTSGTTGLPKAAVMTHARSLFMIYSVYRSMELSPKDILYTALPLYHSAGGLVGIGQALIGGLTVVLRNKFSASKFWTECAAYNCTVAQYIGEICRYLLAVPKDERKDKGHSVRKMFGNGLRPQIWADFVQRFNITYIGEFYGATEGNANLINIWNKVGAVGYVPWFVKFLYPVRLIKVDQETFQPLRDSQGLCIPCRVGEPGLLVGKIDFRKVATHFNGYADDGATEKKILRDVTRYGDAAFNTGDVLVEDEYGYYYFKDRTGDTFRWKGENVATCEVEAVVSRLVGLRDAVVYGVEVNGAEGRAGMAALLDPDSSLDLNKLSRGLNEALPPFARPLFLRILTSFPITGTFKMKKVDLQREGYDIEKVGDPLYFYDNTKSEFVRLDEELYKEIVEGRVRV